MFGGYFIKARVIKGVGGRFEVLCDGEKHICLARGIFKYDQEKIVVGDWVDVQFENGQGIINNIHPRKNQLVRPPICNIDQVVIVISAVPQADFVLIDKIILDCMLNHIDAMLVVNKFDLNDTRQLCEQVYFDYSKVIKNIVFTSVVENTNIDEFKKLLSNKLSCFVGQSAVGKSSLLNAIAPNYNQQTGEISVKSQRGRHTTRHSEIFVLDNGGMIVDTPGFNFLNKPQIDPYELCLYYPDIFEHSEKCKYNMCTHTKEDECGVKQALNNNQLSADRYRRYTEMFYGLINEQNYSSQKEKPNSRRKAISKKK